jgi:HPt (histidine-containing phosphotransfer) domain-containing protein
MPTTASQHNEPIYSTLAGDPILGEIVDLFVAEMPERAAAIRSAFERGDRSAARRAVHQLKGAGGSYGFDQLTSFAGALEFALVSEHAEEVTLRALQELLELCHRIQSKPAGN